MYWLKADILNLIKIPSSKAQTSEFMRPPSAHFFFIYIISYSAFVRPISRLLTCLFHAPPSWRRRALSELPFRRNLSSPSLAIESFQAACFTPNIAGDLNPNKYMMRQGGRDQNLVIFSLCGSVKQAIKVQ